VQLTHIAISNKYDKNIYERAFGNKSEKILIDYISKFQFDSSRIWITNVVQCSVKKNSPYLVSKAFKNCKFLLGEEVLNVNPKIVVTLGKIATDLVTHFFSEFKLNYQHFKMLHPNALSYNSSLKEKFCDQFQKLKEML
jgi:uracil-DNA glycosylase family 4